MRPSDAIAAVRWHIQEAKNANYRGERTDALEDAEKALCDLERALCIIKDGAT